MSSAGPDPGSEARAHAPPLPADERAFHRRPLRDRLKLANGLSVSGPLLLVAGLSLVLGLTAPDHAWLGGLATGALLAGWGATRLRRAAAVKSWPVARGRVLEAGVAEFAVPGNSAWHVYYHPRVAFEYESARGRLRSERFTIAPRDWASLDPADVRRVLEPYPRGAQVDVRVSPDEPALAVLHPHVSRKRRSEDAALLVGGLLVAALSVLLSGL